jgi:hypothetical protein
MNQRLLKVPMCMARMPWQSRVQRTLVVHMREKGSFLSFDLGGGADVLDSCGSSS